MKEKIKFKHLYDNIYSHYVDIYYDGKIIDHLYLEFEYYYKNSTYYHNNIHHLQFLANNYNIDRIYDWFARSHPETIYRSVIYDNNKYYILFRLIVSNKQKYLNQIRKAKLKTIC